MNIWDHVESKNSFDVEINRLSENILKIIIKLQKKMI